MSSLDRFQKPCSLIWDMMQ